MVALGTPAFAQAAAGAGAGGLNIIDIAQNMSGIAIAVAVVLFVMSFWSVVSPSSASTLTPGAQAVEAVCAAGGETPQGRPPEGSDCALLVEGIPLQPPRQGRPRRPAGIPVPAGDRRRSLNREDVLDTVRRSIQRATALTASDLKKGVSTLATIGSTAPFVGLLGTVVGVINAFVGIASTGSGGIGASRPVSAEALIETALGLFVAIPAVWFYNFLTSRIEYFNVEMETLRRSSSITSSRRRRSWRL